MNRVFIAAVSVLTGFIIAIVFLLPRIPVRAGTSGSASQNGDVNGDGVIDVSDTVYALGEPGPHRP